MAKQQDVCRQCTCPLSPPQLKTPFVTIGDKKLCSVVCLRAWLEERGQALDPDLSALANATQSEDLPINFILSEPPTNMDDGEKILGDISKIPGINMRIMALQVPLIRNGFDAIILINQIQLAARHPLNQGLAKDAGVALAKRVQEIITQAIPELEPLLVAGWNPDFDIVPVLEET